MSRYFFIIVFLSFIKSSFFHFLFFLYNLSDRPSLSWSSMSLDYTVWEVPPCPSWVHHWHVGDNDWLTEWMHPLPYTFSQVFSLITLHNVLSWTWDWIFCLSIWRRKKKSLLMIKSSEERRWLARRTRPFSRPVNCIDSGCLFQWMFVRSKSLQRILGRLVDLWWHIRWVHLLYFIWSKSCIRSIIVIRWRWKSNILNLKSVNICQTT